MRSQQKAGKAIASGRLASEIVPVSIPQRKGDPIVVEADEHPRPETTYEKVAKLPTPFRQDGTVTAANASGVNDGAAALLIASAKACEAYGLTPIARVVSSAVAGVPPRIMGIGPAPSTQKLLDRLGLKISDVDVIELNEAFAAQGLAVLRQLGVADDDENVNPNGGAIALGHAIGATGAIITLKALYELERIGGSKALITMCIGGGQGIAIAIERL